MINESTMILARRYATAFLNVYSQHLTEESCLRMKKSTQSLQADTKWQVFFDFSTLDSTQQKNLLTILLKHYGLPDFLFSLGELLCTHHRMSLFPTILDVICKLFFVRHNITSFKITSAPGLTNDDIETLTAFLHKKSGKEIRHICTIDNQLIAGIRAQSSTSLWEHSVAKKLREARQMALNGNN